MPPLDSDQLFAVSATNSNGTKTSASVRFVIDNQGPSITMTVPAVGTIIGSITTIAAVVTDPASVLDSSVVAVVAHGDETFTVKLDPDPTTAGRYSHQFDTRLFNIHDLYPTVSFRASDLLGNESSIGYTVALDNTPPLADLDPSSHFRVRVKTAGTWSCSWEFDPLGSDAVDDGEKTAQLFDVRARVEDRGNTPFSAAPTSSRSRWSIPGASSCWSSTTPPSRWSSTATATACATRSTRCWCRRPRRCRRRTRCW